MEQNTNAKNVINIEKQVTNILRDFGVSANILGYEYLRAAIIMVLDDTSVVHAVTKILYPAIAKKFDTTSSRVERAIRHAIESTCERGNQEALSAFFRRTIKSKEDKPTNTEFIAAIADDLRLGNE